MLCLQRAEKNKEPGSWRLCTELGDLDLKDSQMMVIILYLLRGLQTTIVSKNAYMIQLLQGLKMTTLFCI